MLTNARHIQQREMVHRIIYMTQPIREKYSSIILKLRFLNLTKGMLETKYKVEILKKMSLDLQIEKPEVEPNGIFIFNIIIT